MKKIIVALILILFCLSIGGCAGVDYENDDAEIALPSNDSETSLLTKKECNHSWSSATCNTPQKCNYCGETQGEVIEHSFSEATCTEAKKCALCGESDGSPLGHSYTEATCTSPKKCKNCGMTEGENGNHNYKYGNDGYDTCSVCGNKTFKTLCVSAMENLLQSLKNPYSAQVYGVYAGYYDRSYNEYESGDYIVVIIDSSADNSLGGTVRDDYICLFDYKNNKVIYDLKGTGENFQKLYANSALQGIEMEIEAMSLSAAKTNFEKQDHKFIFNTAKNNTGL